MYALKRKTNQKLINNYGCYLSLHKNLFLTCNDTDPNHEQMSFYCLDHFFAGSTNPIIIVVTKQNLGRVSTHTHTRFPDGITVIIRLG